VLHGCREALAAFVLHAPLHCWQQLCCAGGKDARKQHWLGRQVVSAYCFFNKYSRLGVVCCYFQAVSLCKQANRVLHGCRAAAGFVLHAPLHCRQQLCSAGGKDARKQHWLGRQVVSAFYFLNKCSSVCVVCSKCQAI
jgi:hypothetical protein